MKVAAVIVTRGDVNLKKIVASFPQEWEVLIWTNGRRLERMPPNDRVIRWSTEVPDLAVYGRYAAIEHTDADLIYVQDDDCVLSDPHAIVRRFMDALGREWDHTLIPGVVCNMPANFRARHFYDEHSLVGFGAAFYRDAPARAFEHFFKAAGATLDYRETIAALAMAADFGFADSEDFFRTCDIVFTGLSPRVLVDIGYEDMPWASADNRMWRQPWHQAVRDQMLSLVLEVRDA